MKEIKSLSDLTEFGRVRLSHNFFMREMLYSEVGNFYSIPNIPENPELAIEAGRKLCTLVLEPLRKAFGHITIRSAYRSPTLNGYCHELYKAGDTTAWCIDNEANAAEHIWDHRDKAGFMGATATVVIPGYLDYFEKTGRWQPLAWWIKDNIEHYSNVFFFPHLCAFNIRWYEGKSDKKIVYLDPPRRDVFTYRGADDFDNDHSEFYEGIIPGRC
jgi:hypothetical protein